MCHTLQALGIFCTRGNQGKVYSMWTLPVRAVVLKEHLERLHQATSHLIDALCAEAAINRGIQMDAVKESTITTPVSRERNTWSPFNRQVPDRLLQTREADFLRTRMRAKQTQDIALSYSETDTELVENQLNTIKGLKLACAYCHEQFKQLIPCSKCNSVFYCDSDCREAHWSKHKFDCRLGRSIDEVEELVLACQDGQFQVDDDVAKALGFRSFFSASDRQMLLRIYTKLITKYGVKDDELRQAWQTDKLREFLLQRCSQLPRHDIAIELTWLKHHDELAANVIMRFGKVMESMKIFLTRRIEISL
ncbi:hypothetical protein BDW59DRAFT_167523 [Aspergillus cavernicola]|uniref:MYND-type domain-containing protein n=1 Tax=Aspergillus cavernicola TaxID=176166 RepID=A0ABR4HDC8_9EURO